MANRHRLIYHKHILLYSICMCFVRNPFKLWWWSILVGIYAWFHSRCILDNVWLCRGVYGEREKYKPCLSWSILYIAVCGFCDKIIIGKQWIVGWIVRTLVAFSCSFVLFSRLGYCFEVGREWFLHSFRESWYRRPCCSDVPSRSIGGKLPL